MSGSDAIGDGSDRALVFEAFVVNERINDRDQGQRRSKSRRPAPVSPAITTRKPSTPPPTIVQEATRWVSFQTRSLASVQGGVPQSLEQKRTLSRADRQVVTVIGVTQRSQFTLGDAVGQRERVSPQDVDVLVAQG